MRSEYRFICKRVKTEYCSNFSQILYGLQNIDKYFTYKLQIFIYLFLFSLFFFVLFNLNKFYFSSLLSVIDKDECKMVDKHSQLKTWEDRTFSKIKTQSK